jgi:hypothetical protein
VVKVHLWSGLRRFTDGVEVVQVQANTVGQMLDGLVAAHPGLGPVIATGVSVSIDGVLTASRFGAVSTANEIYLIQRIKGG